MSGCSTAIRRGIKPTIYARALLDRGVVAFDELRQGIEHIKFLCNPMTGELALGSTIAIATGFLPAVIDRLSRKYPRMVFHLSAGEAATTYRTLEEREVDLVVAPIFAPISEEYMSAEILYDEPLVVIARTQRPWAKRRKITLPELMDATWGWPPLHGFLARSSPMPSSPQAWMYRPPRFSRRLPRRATPCFATGRFVGVVQGSVLQFNLDHPAFRVLPSRPARDPAGQLARMP